MTNPKPLIVPEMVSHNPNPGVRAKQIMPEYKGTEVYHSIYLPLDWEKGKKYPVIVEYTGNFFPPSGSSGEVKDANLGYGLSQGKGFIWVVMPFISKDHKKTN